MLPERATVLCEWRSGILDSPHRILCEDLHSKPTRRKEASTKQFIKDSTLSRWKSGQTQRGQQTWGYRSPIFFCEPGSWVMNRVVSNAGCFWSFGGLLPQVGKGSFWPYKVYIWTVIIAFSHVGEGLKPQCECIKMSLGVTLGQR